jgi:hypothetical protein
MRLGDIDRGGAIQQTVRRIFHAQLCKTREEPLELDELDTEYLRSAAENQTVILLLTSLWKYKGELTPQQSEGFVQATRLRDSALFGLGIDENPYSEPAN